MVPLANREKKLGKKRQLHKGETGSVLDTLSGICPQGVQDVKSVVGYVSQRSG